MVDGGIVPRDVDRDRIDVRRDAFRIGPKRESSEREKAGACPDVGNVRIASARLLQAVQSGKAAACRRMLTGAERDTEQIVEQMTGSAVFRARS